MWAKTSQESSLAFVARYDMVLQVVELYRVHVQ